ncbi:hypothetical protein CM49_00675 [Paenibacillus sp. P1XP2]|jgi:hypothetical protein|nr:hypothetical protein CM49_00675 [Paenibacillus sp. P1XP2]
MKNNTSIAANAIRSTSISVSFHRLKKIPVF